VSYTCRVCLLFFALLAPACVWGQPPIGQWREHLPYNTGIRVCEADNKIYCATSQSLMMVDLEDNSIHKLSKTTGLSETGITALKKNPATGRIIIGYSNSNIDLLQNNRITNLNDIKRKNISGDKNIYNIYTRNNLAYICCGFGVVVMDEDRRETRETWIIGNNGDFVKVNGLADDGQFFYAATAEGLKKAPLNSNALADYRNWTTISGLNGLPGGPVADVQQLAGKILALRNDSIYAQQGGNWSFFYKGTGIANINVSDGRLLVCEQGTPPKVTVLTASGQVEVTLAQNNLPEAPRQALRLGGSTWVADFFKGLYKVDNNSFTLYTPNAPPGGASGELLFANGAVWAAAGTVNDAWNYTFNRNGFYSLNNNFWTTYWRFTLPATDTLLDFITLAAANNGSIYAGSFGGGLLEMKENNAVTVYKQNSSLQAAIGDPTSYRVSGLAVDADDNLWVANYGAPNLLHVKKAAGGWRGFSIPFFLNDNAVAQVLVDDANQKWVVSPKSNGLICYNHGASIDNIADDRWKIYKTGRGNGNLPDNDVFCVAKDKDGILWVGTARGIALIPCVSEVFTNAGCEAVLPIVQQDRFAGFLFQNEIVQTIAVDGANRKWVGTKNGVWLISADGDKIIYRFSEDNSALLSNDVKKIAINPQTGEVFFATFKGICSFRSTATEGGETHENVLVFPNPVPPGYNGTIAIKGLAANSIVKITELDGRLVYQTKALGGQAVWNGRNYKGQTVSSGAYLVLVTSETSNEKVAAKIFFISR
jgi:hypothetical protein